MSRRLQMLQVARLARRTLGESAELVAAFLQSLAAPEGGYVNRDGRPDLYYTPFALDALSALDALPTTETNPEAAIRTRAWLAGFGDGESLDFVHCCCLARAWASQPAGSWPDLQRAALVRRIEATRSADGGYAAQPGLRTGTAYGCFLAVNAFADLGQPAPPLAERTAISRCLDGLRTHDGGWANFTGQSLGSTTATAAALATLVSLEMPVPDGAAAFLLAQRHPAGGFVAAADVPLPDLLSTAVALHALDAIDAPWRDRREQTLDFLDSLWSAEGAFHGSWADDHADAEYTFYGLVALGHASV
jgi:prenyltransferase beta subunit